MNRVIVGKFLADYLGGTLNDAAITTTKKGNFVNNFINIDYVNSGNDLGLLQCLEKQDFIITVGTKTDSDLLVASDLLSKVGFYEKNPVNPLYFNNDYYLVSVLRPKDRLVIQQQLNFSQGTINISCVFQQTLKG